MTPEGFAQLSKLIPSPLLLLDPQARVLRASCPPGMPRLWPDRVATRPLSDFVAEPTAEVDRYFRACRRIGHPNIGSLTFLGSQADAGEIRCRCYGAAVVEAGNRRRFVVLRVVPDDGGQPDGFAMLTQRLELQQSLHRGRSEAAEGFAKRDRHLAHLVETTQDAVVFIDGQQTITRFNASAERMFGYSREEILGQPVVTLMGEPHRSNHPEYIRRYQRTHEPRAIGRIREVYARRRDGSEFPIELAVTPIEPEAGVYGAFIRDVSEGHALRARLLERERLAAIGTTAAMFAHEVANPLNGMYMHLQLLSRRLNEATQEPRVINSVERIGSEVQRLIGLLDEFRSLSRRQKFIFESAHLQELVRGCLAEQEPIHRTRRIGFEADLDETVAPVAVDRSKIKQVLLNLCKNAVEAMPDGGTLTIRLRETSGMVRLEIADTGMGIPEHLDVFEPFATTKTDGTGLGLPVVRQVIAAHSGTIHYESEPGLGTTFVIELPVRTSAGSG